GEQDHLHSNPTADERGQPHQEVASAVRPEVAPLLAQPAQGGGRGVRQLRRDLAPALLGRDRRESLRGGAPWWSAGAHEKAAQEGADVAASRDRGEPVDTVQEPAPRESSAHADTERDGA